MSRQPQGCRVSASHRRCGGTNAKWRKLRVVNDLLDKDCDLDRSRDSVELPRYSIGGRHTRKRVMLGWEAGRGPADRVFNEILCLPRPTAHAC